MLNKIKIFIKVVEQGSFSAASNVLDMAPSSISRAVTHLEKELGTTLLFRNTRQISLTPQGVIFYEGVTDIVDRVDSLITRTQLETTGIRGKLKISVFESFGSVYVCKWVSEFLSLYPEAKIDLSLDNALVNLLSDDVDLAIRIGKPKDSELKFKRLCSNKVSLYASPTYLRNVPHKLNVPADLEHHNCLTLKNNRKITFWYFSKNAKQLKIQVSGNLTSKGGTPLLTAACQGLGVTVLADWMAHQSYQKGKLIKLLEHWDVSLLPSTSGDIYALYPSQMNSSPLLKVFVEFISEKSKSLF